MGTRRSQLGRPQQSATELAALRARRIAVAQTAGQLTADETVAADVFERLNPRSSEVAPTHRYNERRAMAQLEQTGRVALENEKLHLNGEAFPLSPKQAQSLTLLEPQRVLLTRMWAGIRSGRTTVLAARSGSGASHTAQWLLNATKTKHRYHRHEKSTPVDVVVGATRPNAQGELKIEDGDLTHCVRNGGVFVFDGLENADEQMRSLLTMLASGEYFHHPVSGEPIKVHRDFRLVVLTDPEQRPAPAALVAQATTVAPEIPLYTSSGNEADTVRLLIDQHKQAPRTAHKLTAVFGKIEEAQANGELDFGRGFPVRWAMLRRVAERVGQKSASPNELGAAFMGLFGKRLADPAHVERLTDILESEGLSPELWTKLRDVDPSFVVTDRVRDVLAHAYMALKHGEAVGIVSPGQAGTTRLVESLGKLNRQDVVTVGAYRGLDAQALREMPFFEEAEGTSVRLLIRPGLISRALLEGKLLHFDHVDALSSDVQSALFDLAGAKTLRLVEDGKIVEKPVHKKSRVVLSWNDGAHRTRTTPDARDRAKVTELRLSAPDVDELEQLLPTDISPAVSKAVLEEVRRIAKASSAPVLKLQRFLDFARASQLLSEHVSIREAIDRAGRLIFPEAEPASSVRRKKRTALWPGLLNVTREEAEQRVRATGYDLTPSMEPNLDALAIAYRLGRPVDAVGPASSGKTVLGVVFSAVLGTKPVRINFSSATDARDVLGGMGAVNHEGRTVFRDMDGPALAGARDGAVIILDELNFWDDQMVFQSALSHRRVMADPERGVEVPLGKGFVYIARNPSSSQTQRNEWPPAIEDLLIRIRVDPKPLAERVEIVAKKVALDRDLLTRVAQSFEDLQHLVAQGRLTSSVTPITCTERDMAQAASIAQGIIERDKVKDPDAQRRIVGREVYRLMSAPLKDEGERELVLSLVRKPSNFGAGVDPAPPTRIEKVTRTVRGEKVRFLKIGSALRPIRPSGDPERDALVPSLDGINEPIGKQLEVLEHLLLAYEFGQPAILIGKTGEGKTMLVRYLAHHLNEPLREQVLNDEMTEDHLFATMNIAPDGSVVLQYKVIPLTAKHGGIGNLDEYENLPNGVREKALPVFEGSEIQISTSRPPETIRKQDWHPDAWFVLTSNERANGLSEAEASRLRNMVMPELNTLEDIERMSVRDHARALPGKAKEAQRAAYFFHGVAQIQRNSAEENVSPLTPRLFKTFMDSYVAKRAQVGEVAAARRAAEITLFAKLDAASQRQALDLLLETYGATELPEESFSPPVLEGESVRFGTTAIKIGAQKPWMPNHRRFPLTVAACKDLELVADAVQTGRPIAGVDDANGANVRLFREFGRLVGQPVTTVTLPKNADIDALIEKLCATTNPEVRSGFEPVLQKIGRAAKDGHLLILRGCGNVRTTSLERLNSLADLRRETTLPSSGQILKAGPDFRMVLLRKPNAPYTFSEALQNRLVEPLLSNRDQVLDDGGMRARVGQLATMLEQRTGLRPDAAEMLAAFHTYLNYNLTQGAFSSGSAVGSFLDRDAVAVASRLATLIARQAEEEEADLLHHLVLQVYGERFEPAADRALLSKLAERAFGSSGTGIQLSSEASSSLHLIRHGDWTIRRSPRRRSSGVPGAEKMMPLVPTLAEVQQKFFAARQFDEVTHLHGNVHVAEAVVTRIAALTGSRIIEVEGNEDLSEAYLLGGLLQNQRTGKFEQYEGLLWKAHREGATLFIKNASRLPAELQTALEEVAATEHLDRVREDGIETVKLDFNLVLHSDEGEALAPELASVCTPIRCPEISDAKELRTLLSHVLIGVPGGDEIATALTNLTDEARRLASSEAQAGREPVRFDSARAFSTAEQLAAAHRADVRLETALADVLTRQFIWPAVGLECEAQVRSATESLLSSLASENGVLQARLVDPFDALAHPELAALKQDFDRSVGAFSSAVLEATAEAVEALASSGADPRTMLGALTELRVLPESSAAQIRRKLAAPAPLSAEELERLAKTLRRAGGGKQRLEEVALEFARGARLWDLDARLEVQDRYREVFGLLAENGSELGAQHAEELGRIRARFDVAGALARIGEARGRVVTCLDAYRKRKGETDKELVDLYRELEERWDMVATSPLFKNHHVLRNELIDLEAVMRRIRAAHEQQGGAPEEMEALNDALRGAAGVLEGIRVIEQGAELRRELADTVRTTEGLVSALKSEVVEIERLEKARAEDDRLAQAARLAVDLGGDALTLSAEFDVPALEPADVPALQKRAHERARAEAAPLVERYRQAQYQKLSDIARRRPVPPLKAFFKDFNIWEADLGIAFDLPRSAPSELEAFEADIKQQVARFAEQKVQELAAEKLDVLVKDDEVQRISRHQEKVALRVRQATARIQRSAADLEMGLHKLDAQLDLATSAPELHANIQELASSLATAKSENAGVVKRLLRSAIAPWRTQGQKREDPALAELRARADETLREILQLVERRQKALPNFRSLDRHIDVRADLCQQLVSADNLGDLASRCDKIAGLAEQEEHGGLRRLLQGVLRDQMRTPTAERLLSGIAAFCSSADLLASRVSAEQGFSVEVAPIVEAVVRAAETIRTQPPSDQAYPQCVKALRRPLQKLAELEATAAAMPPLLGAVRDELAGLQRSFEEAMGGGVIETRSAKLDQMLSVLVEDVDSPARGRRLSRPEMREGAGPETSASDVEIIGRTIEGLEAFPAEALDPFDQVVRTPKLSFIELQLENLALEPRAERAVESVEQDDNARSLVEQLEKAGDGLGARVNASLAKLDGLRRTALEHLDAVDRSVGAQALSRQREELSSLADGLQALASRSGRGFQADLSRVVGQLRQIASAVLGLEQAPPEVGAKLQAQLDGARLLARHANMQDFEDRAHSWAAHALLTVCEVEEQLVDARPADTGEPSGSTATELEALSHVIGELAQEPDALTAYARMLLLAHVRQRIDPVRPVLSASEAQRAEELLQNIAAAAPGVRGLMMSATSEASLTAIVQGCVRLGRELESAKHLTPKKVEAFGRLVTSLDDLLFGNTTDIDGRLRHVDALESLSARFSSDGTKRVAAASKGINSGLSELATALRRQAVEEVDSRFRIHVAAYLQQVERELGELDDAISRFVEFDPIQAEGTFEDAERDLRRAIVNMANMVDGPAAVSFAKRILGLRDRLVGADSGPLAGASARILEELTPMVDGCELLARTPDLSERFAALVDAVRERVELLSRTGVSTSKLGPTRDAVDRLIALTRTDRLAVASELEKLEAELILPQTPKEAPTVIARTLSAVASALERQASGNGAARTFGVHAADYASHLADDVNPQAPSTEYSVGADKPLKADSSLGEVIRGELGAGEVRDPLAVQIVEQSADVQDRMAEAIAEARMAQLDPDAAVPQTELQAFVRENQGLVNRLAAVFRRFPNTEIAVIVDQSSSTNEWHGDSRILDQIRAVVGLILAAAKQGESNVAVIGTGGSVGRKNRSPVLVVPGSWHGRSSNLFIHKDVSEPLTDETADEVYQAAKRSSGVDAIYAAMQLALGRYPEASPGQFTSRANNKLLVVLTDAALGNAGQVRQDIDAIRTQGVGVTVMGFGAAQHVEMVAGAFGRKFHSHADAINNAEELLEATMVDNAGRFRGSAKGGAQGVGVSFRQDPIEAAPSEGPVDSLLDLGMPVVLPAGSATVAVTRGPRMEMENTANRYRYDRAVQELERRQALARATPSYQRCLQNAATLRHRFQNDGTLDALSGVLAQGMPHGRTMEWEGRQPSGPLLDEKQIPLYVVGLDQGIPVVRIFKRRKLAADSRRKVVLGIDESTSISDEQLRLQVEGALAFGDALKKLDPRTEISVLGFSDQVRLHAAFEQTWNDDTKAHILHQVSNKYQATNDERGVVEAAALLRMTSPEIGMVTLFSDGQGMPGTLAALEETAAEGYGALVVGLGPGSEAVEALGPSGVHARNLAEMIYRLPEALPKVWQQAGRLEG